MSVLDLMSGTCSVCGCSGLHACPGYPMKPWTIEEQAYLENALRDIFKAERGDKKDE